MVARAQVSIVIIVADIRILIRVYMSLTAATELKKIKVWTGKPVD
jgi:hypothetical protein